MNTTIEAQGREKAGTGTARALRREGQIPAIVYGANKPSDMITVNERAIAGEANKRGFFNKLWTVKVGSNAQKVIAKDVQHHPVTGQILHMDFMRVSEDSRVVVSIPVQFINEDQSPAIKRQGVLNTIVNFLEVECPALEIPETLQVDLTGLEMHHSVELSRIELPKGVQPVNPSRDAILATVIAPAGEE